MIDLPTRDEVLLGIECAHGSIPSIKDPGLLQSSLMRPATVVAGKDAYPGVWDKAAALMHSLAIAGCLAEANESASWSACWLLLGLNGHRISPELDAATAERFVRDVAANALTWDQISARLPSFAE